MKVPYILTCFAFVSVAPSSFGQNFNSSTFYSPAFTVRTPGVTEGLLSVNVTNTPTQGTQTVAPVKWTHSAGGLIQTRTEVTTGDLIPLVIAELDVQLAATTRTTGTSLVFGRQLTTSATLAGIDLSGFTSNLTALANGLVSASAVYQWSSTATVSNLNIQAGQLYQVSFDVTSAAGLPVGLLSSATFGIDTTGVTGASNSSATLLNLLGLVQVGGSSAASNPYTFTFQSDRALTSLDFDFAAQSTVGANLLGGAAGQDYLTFSGFNVVAVPEPSALGLAGLALTALGFRRRRA